MLAVQSAISLDCISSHQMPAMASSASFANYHRPVLRVNINQPRRPALAVLSVTLSTTLALPSATLSAAPPAALSVTSSAALPAIIGCSISLIVVWPWPHHWPHCRQLHSSAALWVFDSRSHPAGSTERFLTNKSFEGKSGPRNIAPWLVLHIL